MSRLHVIEHASPETAAMYLTESKRLWSNNHTKPYCDLQFYFS